MRAKIIAFMLSSAIIAATGAVRAFYQHTSSYEEFTLELAIQYVAVVIVGGMGYSYGPILGALLVIGVPDFIARGLQGLVSASIGSHIFLIRNALFGILVMYFMTIGPDGVPGALRQARKALSRRLKREPPG